MARNIVSTSASLGGALIERHHVGATPVRLEAVPARTAADVDDLAARADAETVEIDCQHSSPTASLGSPAAAVRAMACS